MKRLPNGLGLDMLRIGLLAQSAGSWTKTRLIGGLWKGWQKMTNKKTIVIDGNKRYWVIIDHKVRYTGNNPFKYWWHRLFTKGKIQKTTVRYGRQGR
jgi:hypothetical protein